MSKERAEELRGEADRLEKRIVDREEYDEGYTDHLQRRADHCRRLARDEERDVGGEG